MSDPSAVVPVGDEETGLEDFDTTTDSVVPRLKIVHREAKFEDTLSKEQFPELKVVLLGLVKQRILWHPDMEDDAQPLCKSYNFNVGYPNDDKDFTFPWASSAFDQAAAIGAAAEGEPVTLPCDACNLKEWGTEPTRGKAPWCTEQHTYPLVYEVSAGTWAPAILTVQKTSLTNSKTYCTAFARSKTPLYTVHTLLTLTAERKGGNPYAIVNFAKGEETDPENWPVYANNYRSTREFLHTPSRRRDDDASKGGTAVAAPARTAPAAAESDAAGDDEPPPF